MRDEVAGLDASDDDCPRWTTHDANDNLSQVQRWYDTERAGRYESELGHGLTLQGERDAWLADLAQLLVCVALRLPPRPRVLDVGCGTGKFSRLIRDALRDDHGLNPVVHGVDESEPMLEVARSLDSAEITYTQADATRLSGAARYDLVVSCQVLDSFERPARLLRRWQQLILDGGYLLTVLSFSQREAWASRTTSELDRLPLVGVSEVEPLADASVAAGLKKVRTGLLGRVSALYGPQRGRYYAIGTVPDRVSATAVSNPPPAEGPGRRTTAAATRRG